MPRAICLLPLQGAALLAVNILTNRICLLPLRGAALLAVDRRPVLESLTISLFYNYGFYGFYGYSLQAGGHRSPEERGRRIRIVRGCLYIIHG